LYDQTLINCSKNGSSKEIMNYTILVNSSDGFEDCWNPFFTLFSKYWQSCSAPILLNTEFNTYTHNALSIRSSKSHELVLDKKLTWSECLIKGLQMIDTPLILYLQEDYFIDDFVNTRLIDEFASMMLNNTKIKHIGLTEFGSSPPFIDYELDNRLSIISNNAKYRISTQAGLWDKKTLLSYLDKDENGWMFEIYGSARSRKRTDLFLTVKTGNKTSNMNAIISYIPTGIIKGKWHHDIPAVFQKNDISVDFNIRGFYKKKSLLLRKIETGRKLLMHPAKLIQFLFS
jgi:hypothetical protein